MGPAGWAAPPSAERVSVGSPPPPSWVCCQCHPVSPCGGPNPLWEDGQREAHTTDICCQRIQDTGQGHTRTTGVGPCDSPAWPGVPLGPRDSPEAGSSSPSRTGSLVRGSSGMPARPAESAQRRAEQSAMLVSSKQGDRAGFKTEPRELGLRPRPCSLASVLSPAARAAGGTRDQGCQVLF